MNFYMLADITDKKISTLKQAFWRKGLSIKNNEDIQYYLYSPKPIIHRKRNTNYLKKYQFKKHGIPPRFFYFFWFCNPRSLDTEKNQEDIIRHILNYGDHRIIRWMFKKYGIKKVKDVYTKTKKTYFKPQTHLFCNTLFHAY